VRGLLHGSEMLRFQGARECHVEREALHHMGIAPPVEKRSPPLVELLGAASLPLLVAQGGAEGLEGLERRLGRRGERCVILGEEGEEVREAPDGEADRKRRVVGGEGVEGPAKVGFRHALSEAEGSAHRGVKAVAGGNRGKRLGRGGRSQDGAGEGRSAEPLLRSEREGRILLRRQIDGVPHWRVLLSGAHRTAQPAPGRAKARAGGVRVPQSRDRRATAPAAPVLHSLRRTRNDAAPAMNG